MADTTKKVSELTSAAQLNNTDLLLLSQGSAGSYASLNTTLIALANKIVTNTNYTSDLHTNSKTITGALNEIFNSGNLADTYDTTETYEEDIYCIYQGLLYKCIAETTGEFDTDDWVQTTITDELAQGGGGGTTVIANPTGTPTDDLNSIQIGSDIYRIVGGGSSGGGGSNPAYSTNETSYCAWVDGTTVYQKTFTVDGDGTTRDFTVQTGITNGKRLVNAHVSGLRWDSASKWWSPCYINIDDFSWSTHFSLNADFSEFNVKARQYPLKDITVTLYYTKTDDIPYHGGGGYTEVTGTLTAGQTEIVLVDSSITQNSTFEPFTNKFGVNPTDMEVLGHTYEGQVNDILTAQDLTKVTASSNETSVNSKEWKAFDGADGDTNGNSWLPARDDAPCWLQYEFSTAKYISEVKLHCFNNMSNLNYNAPAKIQASNDGTTWTDISESTNIQLTGTTPADITFTCDESQSWTYVRLYSETCLLVYGGASCFVGEMEIYGGTLGTPSLKLTFPVQSENLNVKVRVS